MPDNILFSTNAATDLRDYLDKAKYTSVCVLTDGNTRTHCYPLVEKQLPQHSVITVGAGEAMKTLTTCEAIWEAMTRYNLDRHSLFIIIGGGVLGDMGGFCAATFKRGIPFILVPTTLLSQVDSSIGGKLGVDFQHLKNHLGVFQFPALNLIDSTFLKTLPEEELRSGFAEVIKHILTSDNALWQEVSRKGLNQDWSRLIRHSVDFKLRIVTEDPRENGLRKILNAGHTIGHAMETVILSKGRQILHGEAVAAGLVCEAWIANRKKMLGETELLEIANYVKSVFGKLDLSTLKDEELLRAAEQDKKNKGNKILCVLLEGIGKARWDCEISSDEVKGALSFYRNL